jgi:general secretion pathway protein G
MTARYRGITLIEVLIVVIVLAILAAVVTPQFSRASTDTQLGTLRGNLLDVRAQVRLYRTQHGDRYPTLQQFVAQMTQPTNAEGHTGSQKTAEFNFGPYLHAIPLNPYTGKNSVTSGEVGTSDWYYDETTGLFRANHDSALTAY